MEGKIDDIVWVSRTLHWRFGMDVLIVDYRRRNQHVKGCDYPSNCLSLAIQSTCTLKAQVFPPKHGHLLNLLY